MIIFLFIDKVNYLLMFCVCSCCMLMMFGEKLCLKAISSNHLSSELICTHKKMWINKIKAKNSTEKKIIITFLITKKWNEFKERLVSIESKKTNCKCSSSFLPLTPATWVSKTERVLQANKFDAFNLLWAYQFLFQ